MSRKRIQHRDLLRSVIPLSELDPDVERAVRVALESNSRAVHELAARRAIDHLVAKGVLIRRAPEANTPPNQESFVFPGTGDSLTVHWSTNRQAALITAPIPPRAPEGSRLDLEVAASLLALGDRLLPTDGALPAQPPELIHEAVNILERLTPSARVSYVRYGSPLDGIQVNGAGDSDMGLTDAFARLVPPETRAVAYVPLVERLPDIATALGEETHTLIFASVGVDEAPHPPHGYLVITSPTAHAATDQTLHAVALVAHRLSESLRRADQLEQLVFHDALTGLYNRNFFNRQIEREIARAKRAAQPFALAIADIDDFKAVNTEYGYYGGNDLLEQVSSVLKASIRPFDIAARWGGEEFAYILTPPILADAAVAVCDRIRAAIAAHAYTVSGLDSERHRLDLSVSIGLAMYPDDGTTSRELWTAANEAIKRAKAGGKNKVVRLGTSAD